MDLGGLAFLLLVISIVLSFVLIKYDLFEGCLWLFITIPVLLGLIIGFFWNFPLYTSLFIGGLIIIILLIEYSDIVSESFKKNKLYKSFKKILEYNSPSEVKQRVESYNLIQKGLIFLSGFLFIIFLAKFSILFLALSIFSMLSINIFKDNK